MNKWFKFFVYMSFIWGIFFTIVGSLNVFSSQDQILRIAELFVLGISPLGFSVYFLQKERNLQIRQKEAARQKNMLELASKSGGMLTTSDVAESFRVTINQARLMLDSYVEKGLADIEITREGILAYRFRVLVK
jgi:hypothetical protein